MKDSISQQDYVRYKNMIRSFVNTAIAHTEGVAREYNVKKSGLGITTMNTKNIRVYILENDLTVDLFIGVLYGYVVPKVVCSLQEKIISYVKENTPFDVKAINVNVANVIFA